MKRILLILLFTQQLLVAQDLKINKQYITAPNLINPAFTGNQLCFKADLISTFQWLGMENSPKTYLLNIEQGYNSNQYQDYSKHGLGGTIYRDANGPFAYTGIRASYAFHAWINKVRQVRLSLGLCVTGTWYSLNQSLLYRNSSVIPDNPALNYSQNNSIIPNMGAGVVLYYKKAYTGFSALNMLPVYPSYERVSVGKQSYYFIAGYEAYFKNSDVLLEPILMYNLSNNGIQVIDLTLKSIIKQKIGIGLTYRHSLISMPGSPNSLAVRFSLIKNHWTYSYMYDLSFNSLQFSTLGSHEISIGYRLCPNQTKKCPAY
jgi:type IX secretion system PorP/SprF family membrane protein